MKIANYVTDHAIRGECQCGKCFDAIANPEEHQPDGHTANLVFFKVANNCATEQELRSLVEKELPFLLNGKEHSYLQIGAEVGDQSVAMMLMGLGSLLGLWTLFTPYSVLGEDCPESMAAEMAGMGMITIKANKFSGESQ